MGAMRSFRGPGAHFRSDVVQCAPMRSDSVISHTRITQANSTNTRDVRKNRNSVRIRFLKTEPSI